ncbi:MAG: SPOR domain-containing protein [Bacteroidota bacterium]
MLTGKWIAFWLSTHDVLIINGLGVFKCEDTHSYIHPVDHSFTPPARSVSFSFDATAHDDLIAEAISMSFSISLEKAESEIKSFSFHILEALKTEKKCVISDFGTFTKNGNNISFTPEKETIVNSKYFGLTSFQIPFIRRINSADPLPKKKKNFAKVWIWTISLLIIAFTAFVIVYFDVYDQLWGDKNKALPLLTDTIAINKKIDTTQINPNSSIKDSSDIQNDKELYYIIYGCYKEEQNAQKAIRQLKEKGYPNGIICGTNNNGFFKVSYGVYSTKEEADSALKSINANGKTEAWITK